MYGVFAMNIEIILNKLEKQFLKDKSKVRGDF